MIWKGLTRSFRRSNPMSSSPTRRLMPKSGSSNRSRRRARTAVIPPRQNRASPRPYDKTLYAERGLIENFFCKLKQFRAIATRYARYTTLFGKLLRCR